jgi:hypothetical protein
MSMARHLKINFFFNIMLFFNYLPKFCISERGKSPKHYLLERQSGSLSSTFPVLDKLKNDHILFSTFEISKT